jgi:hypothetical protein
MDSFECRHSRVCGSYVATLFNWTPILEWYRESLVVKNGPKKDTCYNKIGLCAQVPQPLIAQ